MGIPRPPKCSSLASPFKKRQRNPTSSDPNTLPSMHHTTFNNNGRCELLPTPILVKAGPTRVVPPHPTPLPLLPPMGPALPTRNHMLPSLSSNGRRRQTGTRILRLGNSISKPSAVGRPRVNPIPLFTDQLTAARSHLPLISVKIPP